MVWNAVNDPLFGYLQDNSRVPCCSQRRLSILYGAPFYAIAFLLAWFPWREYAPGDWMSGVHLMVALCAFNGMLTFVLLAQCALFAEISGHHQSRLRLIKYNQVGKGGVLCIVFFVFYTLHFSLYMVFICCLKSVKSVLTFVSSSPSSPQVASLIGSSSVLFCGLLSQNMDDFPSFQGFTVLVAGLACGCMIYTGLHSKSRFDTKGSAPGSNYQGSGQSTLSFSLVTSMTLQILTNRDFQLFVLMNFFQVRK